MKNNLIHKLRLIAGFALIGSVLTGTFFGWVHAPFDLQIVGALVGALAGTALTVHTA